CPKLRRRRRVRDFPNRAHAGRVRAALVCEDLGGPQGAARSVRRATTPGAAPTETASIVCKAQGAIRGGRLAVDRVPLEPKDDVSVRSYLRREHGVVAHTPPRERVAVGQPLRGTHRLTSGTSGRIAPHQLSGHRDWVELVLYDPRVLVLKREARAAEAVVENQDISVVQNACAVLAAQAAHGIVLEL